MIPTDAELDGIIAGCLVALDAHSREPKHQRMTDAQAVKVARALSWAKGVRAERKKPRRKGAAA